MRASKGYRKDQPCSCDIIPKMANRALIGLVLVLVAAVGAAYFIFSRTSSSKTVEIPEIKNIPEQEFPKLSIVAKNLEIPWSLVFLPTGEIVFTERPGRANMIKEGSVNLIAQIARVKHIGEGGLLGIEIDPDFAKNNFVYLYYTYSESGGETQNRVARYTYDGKTLGDPKVLVDGIPGASNHNGGRIKFGPDGYLYITTGDAQESSRSQDTLSLAGKILRITKEGNPAPANPFGTLVYSYGHRNPQGLAWDEGGRLWATEHGRSGVQSGLDELNLIEAGKNYGWPEIEGDEQGEGMVTPVINSGASTTWAPSGAAYLNGSIYFTGLRGTSLFEYNITTKNLKRHLQGEIGRIRDVVIGPDNMLYITTSNRDGRGNPTSDDDRIIRVNPEKLQG